MRPIDADAAIQELCQGKSIMWQDAIIRTFERVPTIDAMQVVRCGECSHCLVDRSSRAYHVCMISNIMRHRVSLDDFCSRGARMDGEEAPHEH